MKAIAVIGAMYGDEGKGLMTDYFSFKNKNSIVIRYNGSAQCGHTVVTPEGSRHVFSHFGSGSFNNVPTYFSEFFVAHPMLFEKEFHSLSSIINIPKQYINPMCMVTTPYDMILNQLKEHHRGNNRHGSVGIGFGETFDRHKYEPLYVSDLYNDLDKVRLKLKKIRDIYIPSKLDITETVYDKNLINTMFNESLLENFISSCNFFVENVELADYDIVNNEILIFEGGQGLMLDMEHGKFPNVTRSHTGLRNILDILRNYNIEHLDICYVSRAYTTRHGAGHLPFEEKLPSNVIDKTNVTNEFQGEFRYSPLNLDMLNDVISKDMNHIIKANVNYSFSEKTVFTCLDQIDDSNACFIKDNSVKYTLADKLTKMLYMMGDYVSEGPTRNSVKELICDF